VVQSRLIAAFAVLAAAPLLCAASLDVGIGKKLFERNWVSAPSSTQSDDGLGPLYDAPSCAACHVPNPNAQIDETSTPPGLVVRLGNAHGGGDPVYGVQLQTRGVAGQVPEANPDIRWALKDGLRVAIVTAYGLGYGALAGNTKIALRRAPPIRGAGLLAQIPDGEILSRAASSDAKHEGIAGHVPWLLLNGKRVLGRFGWKATQPDLTAQTAIAFSRDIGLSTRLDPAPWGDCTAAERACRAGPHGSQGREPEIADALLDLLVRYVAQLGPPPAAPPSGNQELFAATGCGACHATLHLADGAPVAAYTDLLLHDLGPGLNDGIAEGAAPPGFWRTAPLWDVSESLKSGGLLHDGRARNVGEAVEWHAGEAAPARARFRALTAADKAALVAFVSGL
jgi:CxxC motif-containing protein (DUF1111 family)